VLDHPERAEEDRIIATPTVIRLVPVPPKRVIGDLSDLELAAIALDLPDAQDAATGEGDGT
jgi:circadian clock protein KaiB